MAEIVKNEGLLPSISPLVKSSSGIISSPPREGSLVNFSLPSNEPSQGSGAVQKSGDFPVYDPSRWSSREEYYQWLYQNYGIKTTLVEPDGNSSVIDHTQPITPNWSPNTDLTPEENLSDLESYIEQLFNLGSFGFDAYGLINGTSVVNILRSSLAAVKELYTKYYGDVASSSVFWQITEKVADTSQKFLDLVMTQTLNYKNWYMQQDYNTPANQLRRLEDAGLSSAFIFGGLSSGNAQSSPSASMMPSVSPYGIGTVAQAERAASQQYDVGMLDAYAHSSDAMTALLNHNVNSIKTLAEADNIRRMTPIQVASAIQEFNNLGVTFDYLNAEVLKIQNDTFSDWFKNDFASYQQDVQSANQRVEQIQNNLNNASTESFALSMGSKFIDTEVYSGFVKSKSGQRIRKDYTLDQLSNAYSNGGYDEEGNEVFSEKDLSSSGSVNGGLSIPGIGFDVGASGTIAASDKDGNKSSSKSGHSHSLSNTNSSSSGHYDDKTRTLTIGDQSFTRTTSRKLMTSEEYVSYMDKLKSDLIKAKDDYFLLTTGERARAFQNYQLYLENKAKGLSWSLGSKIKYYLRNLNKPSLIVGD